MTSRSLAEHRAAVLAALPQPTQLQLTLSDAVGCVVVEDVVAPDAVPPVAIAACDGYAVRAAETPGPGRGPVTVPVTHDVLPGNAPTRLLAGTAARIARGGALPFGADAVVARVTGDAASVSLTDSVAPGTGVVAAGRHAAAGEVLVPAGARLASGHIAALAACGVKAVTVRPAPRIVIIAIGSELATHAHSVHVSQRPHEPTQEASGAMLASLAAGAGARVVRVETIGDEAGSLRRALDDAVLQAELIITIGGTSDDWHDVVTPVLEHALGVEFAYVRLGEGGRHGVGTLSDGHGRPAAVLAIPGYPLDAVAAFVGYVRDAILALRGLSAWPAHATVAGSWASPFGFTQVIPVALTPASQPVVVPVGDPASPTVRDLARADGLALVDESITAVSEGTVVDVHWWER